MWMEEVVPHLFSLVLHSSHPSEADCLVPEQFSFYSVMLLASRPTLNLEDQGIPLRLVPPLDLSGMGDPTSSYAIASIALRASGAIKPHHHDKVETPSLVYVYITSVKRHIV
jgi:hypothetical protein